MSTTWDIIINEIISGSLSSAWSLLKILIPLMIVIEILMVYNVIEKLAKKLEFLGKFMGMSKNAVFPLLVGVFMGVTYGAGTLIELNERNPLEKKDFMLIGVFMYTCHGIIETGVIFANIGVSPWIVVGLRLIMSMIITMILARTKYFKTMQWETAA